MIWLSDVERNLQGTIKKTHSCFGLDEVSVELLNWRVGTCYTSTILESVHSFLRSLTPMHLVVADLLGCSR